MYIYVSMRLTTSYGGSVISDKARGSRELALYQRILLIARDTMRVRARPMPLSVADPLNLAVLQPSVLHTWQWSLSSISHLCSLPQPRSTDLSEPRAETQVSSAT